MSSPTKIAANRANARRSTGPRTLDGKARASRNALTHGLSARRAVLPNEDPAEYAAFVAAHMEDLRPVGCVETSLVRDIATCSWRLARVPWVEAVAVAQQMAASAPTSVLERRLDAIFGPADPDRDRVGPALVDLIKTDFLGAKLGRHDAALAHRRERALALLFAVQAQRRDRDRRLWSAQRGTGRAP